MQRYAFILGRTPLLSLAELAHTLPHDARPIAGGAEGVIVEFGERIQEPVTLLGTLGGTQKLGTVIAEGHRDVEEKIIEALRRELPEGSGKRPFAVSLYAGTVPARHEISLKNLLKKGKKALQADGRSVRFINQDFQNASTVAVEKERLMTQGVDLSIITTDNGFFIAKTIAVQPFAAYSRRDYDRPARDARAGMIPPKLAQMMLNCSRDDNGRLPDTIYDPFCGSGTIVTEAMLLGTRLYGSDLEKNAVESTEQNSNWLYKTFLKQTGRPFPTMKLFQKDATKLEAADLPNGSFAIVTEPLLGPPQKESLTEATFRPIAAQLTALYEAFFKNLRPLLSKPTSIVIAFPTFRIGKEYRSIPQLIEKIRSLGYSTRELVPAAWGKTLAIAKTDRISYHRPDQLVGREIVKFLPN